MSHRLRRLGRKRAAGADPPATPAVHPFADLAAIDDRDSALLRRMLAWHLGPDSCCIDAGANTGNVLVEMCRVAPEGRHIAFEPLPHLAAQLRTDYPDVEVHNAALADSPGEETFLRVRAAEAWSGLVFRPLPGNADGDIEEITVKVEVLDETLPPDFVPSFLKIDVEGGEERVLRGALGTLRRHAPLVVFEHGYTSANAYGTEPDTVFGLLVGEAGMRIFDLDGNGPYELDEFKRSYYAEERVNWVAHL